ncbi:ribbon-helix-helix domain-containing protein [Candidatus Odyssella acanthamoebae]|uniref:ribbon-helix-helix domain-containing protein n=1 Tax=Candidatus Odyssella acanthamoebae TaxID=91604 RepID=UPI00056EA1C4|nr:ribbon-helix-helix domain-containing protein [Candidatus Paracaedibacter acanthamoebae]
MTAIVKKSIDLFGHSTSITMEQEFWDALKHIAEQQNKSVRQLVLEVDRYRLESNSPHNLSGSLRVFILRYFINQSKTPLLRGD